MGDVLPGIIGNVGCHQDEVIQMLLPNVLPAVDDPSIMFQHPLRDFSSGTTIDAWQALYLWVNFRYSPDCERLSDLHTRGRKEP